MFEDVIGTKHSAERHELAPASSAPPPTPSPAPPDRGRGVRGQVG